MTIPGVFSHYASLGVDIFAELKRDDLINGAIMFDFLV